MADLPSIGTAALPANYHAATEALATCNRIDECKDWADKMAALASYAKQADDQTLHHLAIRISARAIRRCGELLQTFQNERARTDLAAGTHPQTQRQAAEQAGMSEHQEKQAVRVANVPAEAFEAAVECDHPATVTQLAEMGKTSKAAPPGFVHATQAIGTVKHFAIFCREQPAPFIAGAIYPYEVAAVRADVAIITEWFAGLLVHLPEAE
jgi:hypothetical protein